MDVDVAKYILDSANNIQYRFQISGFDKACRPCLKRIAWQLRFDQWKVDDRSSLPLETPVKHSVIAADAIHLSENPVQLRNFVSHFVITPRQRLAHECNEILQGFHKTTISENTKRLDRD